jgi:hypothetical protein
LGTTISHDRVQPWQRAHTSAKVMHAHAERFQRLTVTPWARQGRDFVRDLGCFADEPVQHGFRPALAQSADNVNNAHRFSSRLAGARLITL